MPHIADTHCPLLSNMDIFQEGKLQIANEYQD